MDPLQIVLVVVLALIVLVIGLVVGWIVGSFLTNREWMDKLPSIREEAIKRSRAVLGGQFSEQLAPYLPDFGYNPTEARFIGKPIDFIVFEGMDEKDIERVVFVEVKSGEAGLSKHERKLRDVIKDKRVEWREYRIPKELTGKG